MRIRIYPDNPSSKSIAQAVEMLESGGVIIYPTDTLYALGCDLYNHKALDRLCRLRGVKTEKALFSLLCPDLGCLADYTRPVSNTLFKLLRRNTPGPFTFVLPANSQTPKVWQSKRKTIGIRIPDNAVARALAETLGHPMVTASLRLDDAADDTYLTDPELMEELFGRQVDLIVDGGPGFLTPSTVVDCTSGEPVIIRQGAGRLE